jgi:hypothetical protein
MLQTFYGVEDKSSCPDALGVKNDRAQENMAGFFRWKRSHSKCESSYIYLTKFEQGIGF